jgi:hypothetical protein
VLVIEYLESPKSFVVIEAIPALTVSYVPDSAQARPTEQATKAVKIIFFI